MFSIVEFRGLQEAIIRVAHISPEKRSLALHISLPKTLFL